MTDEIFEYEECKLLRKRPSAIRERLLCELEFRALFEEAASATDIRSDELPIGSDAFRFVQGGKNSEIYRQEIYRV
jgi:hypothetical protein